MEYRNYLLIVLTLVLAFNYVDRLALGVVLEDIKADLDLSDTQLGFLTGIAFAAFYSVMGIPIARWADRGNRVTIISVTTALWSVAVTLCAAAANFAQLLLIRIGVAVGEAGCYAPSLSLISDHFSRSERPRAVARFMLGIPLAMMIGYFAAGWLNQLYGWRTTFCVLGLPGLVLAALVRRTLKEPRSSSRDDPSQQNQSSGQQADSPSIKEVLGVLWKNTAYRHLLYCFSIWGFFGYGILQWQPAFFMRSHGLETGPLGTWLVVVYGVGGLLGTALGGTLASRYAVNDERLQLRAIAILYAGMAVISAGVYLAPTHPWAFGILALSALGGAAANGPLFAASQTLVPPRMRAMSIAVMYFFCNLIGLGLGPLAVGALSDFLRPELGAESLRYALLAFCPGYLWCAWHLWIGSRTASEEALAHALSEGAAETVP